MKIFTHPSTKTVVVSDLRWQVLDPFEQGFFGHKDIPRLIEQGTRFHAKYKNTSEVNIGTTTGDFEGLDTQGQRLVSLAAALATNSLFAEQTCLVFIQAGEGAASVGIAVGMIAGNVVLDEEFLFADIDAVYERFAEMCKLSSRAFSVHGDLSPIGVQITQKITLDEILRGKQKNTVKVKPLKSGRGFLLFLLGSLISLIGLVSWGIWDWTEEQEKARIAAAIAQKNSPDNKYAESVAALMQKEMWIMPISMKSITEEIGKFPAILAGWRLEHLDCKEIKCEATWKSMGGTYLDFQNAAPKDIKELRLANDDKSIYGDLKTIKHDLYLNIEKSKISPKSEWPKFSDFRLPQGTDMQKLAEYKWTFKLDGLKQQAIPKGVTENSVKSHRLAVFALPWKIEQQSWSKAALILPLFKSNVAMDRFELFIKDKSNVADQITFTASGLIYVQK